MGAAAFPLLVRPIEGESCVSLLSRAADENGFRLAHIMTDIGESRRPDGWEERHWQKLGRRLSLAVSRFEQFRRRPGEIATAPAAIEFLGKPIHPQYLVTDRLRVCPTCIRERRMHKEIWRLVHCVACSDHHVRLVDTCRCGRAIDLVARDLDPFACVCGLPFGENETEPASEAALRGAQWIEQAFGSKTGGWCYTWYPLDRDLQAPFTEMSPYDVMAVIDLIGQAATIAPDADQAVTSGKRWRKGDLGQRRDMIASTTHVEAAMDVLHRWPEAYDELIDGVAGRNAAAGTATPRDLFATRIGQFVLTPYRGLDGRPIEVLQQAVDTFLERRGYAIRQKIPARSSATARSIQFTMPCRAVAKALGLKPGNVFVKRVYREVVAAFDAMRDAPVDPMALGHAVLADVKQRLKVLDDYMSGSATSEYLCHPDIATYSRMWVHAELLQPIGIDRTIFTQFKSGEGFLRADVERMRRKISDTATRVAEDAVPKDSIPT